MNKLSVRGLISNSPARFKIKPMLFAGLLTSSLLLNGCGVTTVSETGQTICRELERDLPTYSAKDTPETLTSGADFLDVFYAVCGGLIK